MRTSGVRLSVPIAVENPHVAAGPARQEWLLDSESMIGHNYGHDDRAVESCA